MPDREQQKRRVGRNKKKGGSENGSTAAASGNGSSSSTAAASAPVLSTTSTKGSAKAPPPPRSPSAHILPGMLNNHKKGGSRASDAVMSSGQKRGGSLASEAVMRGATTPTFVGGKSLANIIDKTLSVMNRDGAAASTSTASASAASKNGGGRRKKQQQQKKKKGGAESDDSSRGLSRLFVSNNKNKAIPGFTPAKSDTKTQPELPLAARQPGATLPPRVNDKTYLPKDSTLTTGQPFSISGPPLTNVGRDFSTEKLASKSYIMRI